MRHFPSRAHPWLLAVLSCLSGCRHGYEILGDESVRVDGDSGGSSSTSTGGTMGVGASDGEDGGSVGSGGDESAGGSSENGGTGTGGSGGGDGTGGSDGVGGDALGVGGDTSGSGGATVGSGGATGAGGSSGGTGGSGGTTGASPVASFIAAPVYGTTTTSFSFDASGSSDAEDAFGSLTFEWDFEGTGTFVEAGSTPAHGFGSPGDYTVTLRVTDTDGLESSDSETVHVVSDGDLLEVTTTADEEDSGATASNPLGAGLSLREALLISNNTAGRQVILVTGGMFSKPTSNLPQVTDPVDIIGDGTGGIDGTSVGATRNCLQVFAGDTRIVGLEIFNCPRSGLQITTGNNVEVSDCSIHDVGSYGVFVGTSSGHKILHNVVERTQYGIYVSAGSTLVENNEVWESSGYGIFTANTATDSIVVGNLVVGGTTGCEVGGPNIVFAHNTIVESSDQGVIVLDPGTDFRNNIIAFSGKEAILGYFGNFAYLDYSIFFQNALGVCTDCNPGPNTSTVDPLFIDSAGGDYRLLSSSPAKDAGIDLGYDRNGTSAGLFSGAAPDYGYHEQ